ncbi:MAG: hypothetical protein IIC66_11340 [candidate division Zixibacteria bacterium]|nr:hypothetical protein [candidate division Zixibacteria bacterium]
MKVAEDALSTSNSPLLLLLEKRSIFQGSDWRHFNEKIQAHFDSDDFVAAVRQLFIRARIVR